MRQISYQEMERLVDSYTGKQIQIDLSPIQASNTYSSFKFRDLGDMLELYSINFDKSTSTQELVIPKNEIKEIMFYEGKNIYESVFSIVLENGQVDFSISELPTICHKCGKLLDKYYEPSWQINQVGSYGSQWDNQRKIIDLCEDCLLEFLGYKDGDIQ